MGQKYPLRKTKAAVEPRRATEITSLVFKSFYTRHMAMSIHVSVRGEKQQSLSSNNHYIDIVKTQKAKSKMCACKMRQRWGW